MERRLVGRWEGRPTEADAENVTDLSRFDLRITLDLQPGGTAVMWRDNGVDRLTGTWRVLKSEGMSAVLQLSADRSAGEELRSELRNFGIEFDDEGQAFKLTEEGADPRFGSLSFVKKS